MGDPSNNTGEAFKEKVHSIIFEAETPAGKAFDIGLLIVIIASVIVVLLESVESIASKYGTFFLTLEWIFTILFTIEYILRIYCVFKPWKYITSPLGIIDLVSTLPTYLSVMIPHSQSFMVIRLLRLLRVFRLFKLGSFMQSSKIITQALKESRSKIAVFLFFVVLLVTIVGSVMYFIEGSIPDSKFTSIPRSIYWAIVTLTTVGYGDIAPVTEVGQFLAACLMITGYAVIAVPTGIVSAEMVSLNQADLDTQSCMHCAVEGHPDDAIFCHQCGKHINEAEEDED